MKRLWMMLMGVCWFSAGTSLHDKDIWSCLIFAVLAVGIQEIALASQEEGK